METYCSHDAVYALKLKVGPEVGDVFHQQEFCPKCGKLLEVEYIKTMPMVDDVELSPEWCAHGFKEVT